MAVQFYLKLKRKIATVVTLLTKTKLSQEIICLEMHRGLAFTAES